MKKLLIFILLYMGLMPIYAQKGKFDPIKFQADLEQFITTQAALTPQEAAAFFPIYREMATKQRALFDQMRRYHHVDTSDDKACQEAIRVMDKNDIEIKQLQQVYHAKFLTFLPAGKVMRVIKAENKFHRMAFKRMAPK